MYASTPDSSEFRSIDIFLLVCTLFVFGVLVEYALVGVSKPKMYEESIFKRRHTQRKRDLAAKQEKNENVVIYMEVGR